MFIKLQLVEMGFPKDMIDNLFIHHKIADSNQAVDMLMKNDRGWTHDFIRGFNAKICLICNDFDV